MASYGTITVEAKWKQESGDGSPCIGCGDACFISMWRLWLAVARSYEFKPCDPVLCQSCGDCIAERLSDD